MLFLSIHRRSARALGAAILPLLVPALGCDGPSKAQPGAAGSAAAAPSGRPSSGAGASAAAPEGSAVAAAMPVDGAAPRGAGVTSFKALADVEACKPKTGEMATYLQRQGVGLAGRSDGTFASVWLVELQNRPDAQIAFAGFDGEAKQVARGRSLGATREEGLRVFPSGDAWAVTWLDAEGLAYARPRWETNPPAETLHLGAVGKQAAENVAIAPAPSGALVAAAPFGEGRDQLGVFLFAPADAAQPAVQALGVTHHAKQPRMPAVAADAGGYFVAWHEEGDGSIQASRFDAAGKEGPAHVVAAAGAKRERLSLAATEGGAVAVWSEGDTLIARALDGAAKPTAAAWVVGKGKWRAVASTGQAALVAWVGSDGKTDGQLLVAKLGADGAPPAEGLRVTDGAAAVKDPPGVAVAGGRAGLAWTEAMGPAVSSKRAVLRAIDAACIP